MNRREIEHRVRRISWPTPSPALRDRVLSTAVVAEHPITWSDRMWFSRAWRLAAVGTALAVLALDQFSGSPRSTGFTATPQAVAEAEAIEETGRQVGLPDDLAASLGRRVLLEASRIQPPPESASLLLQSFEVVNTGERR